MKAPGALASRGFLFAYQHRAQQDFQSFGGYRAAEVIALYLIAGVLAQDLHLLGGLDALRDHLQAQIAPQGDDGANDRRIIRVAGDVLDERAVDLQTIHREALQGTQARIAGAEVIDGNLHADAFEFPEHADQLRRIVHHALGEFDFKVARVQAGLLQGLIDRAHEVVAAELPGGDIDRDHHRRQPPLLPQFVLRTGAVQHPFADRRDEPGFLRQGNEALR